MTRQRGLVQPVANVQEAVACLADEADAPRNASTSLPLYVVGLAIH
jgi:hypothetical protein